MPKKPIQKKHYSDDMSDLEVWQQLQLRANEVAKPLQFLIDKEQKNNYSKFVDDVADAKKTLHNGEQRNEFKRLILECDHQLIEFDIRKSILEDLNFLKDSIESRFEFSYSPDKPLKVNNEDNITLSSFLEAVEKVRLINEMVSSLKAQVATRPYDPSQSQNLYNSLSVLRAEWAKLEPVKSKFARFIKKSNVIDGFIGALQQVCSIKKSGPVTLTRESLKESIPSELEKKIQSSNSDTERKNLIDESVNTATSTFTSGFTRYCNVVDNSIVKLERVEYRGYTDADGKPMSDMVRLNPEEINNSVLYNNMIAQHAFNSAINEVKKIVKVLVNLGEPVLHRILLPDQAFILSGVSGLNLLNLLNDKEMGPILREDKRTTQAIDDWCNSKKAVSTLVALYSKNKNLEGLKSALQEGNKIDPSLSATLSASLKRNLNAVINSNADKNEKKAAKNVLAEVEKIEKALLKAAVNQKSKGSKLGARSSTKKWISFSLSPSQPLNQDASVKNAAVIHRGPGQKK